MTSNYDPEADGPPFDVAATDRVVEPTPRELTTRHHAARSSRRHHDSSDPAPRHTRISAAWVAVSVAVVFGVALIVFIAQNTRRVHIEFFTINAQVPVAVALLAAALAGAIVVLAIGVGRVTQLRLNLRRQRRRLADNANDVERPIEPDVTPTNDDRTDPTQ